MTDRMTEDGKIILESPDGDDVVISNNDIKQVLDVIAPALHTLPRRISSLVVVTGLLAGASNASLAAGATEESFLRYARTVFSAAKRYREERAH